VVAQPVLNAATDISANSLTISWTKPDEGGGARDINEYVVEWISNDGSSDGLKRVSNKNTIQTCINGLSSNTVYTITVIASNDGNIIGEKSNNEIASTCKYNIGQLRQKGRVIVSHLT